MFDGIIDVYIIEGVEGFDYWDTNHCLDHKASPSKRTDSIELYSAWYKDDVLLIIDTGFLHLL